MNHPSHPALLPSRSRDDATTEAQLEALAELRVLGMAIARAAAADILHQFAARAAAAQPATSQGPAPWPAPAPLPEFDPERAFPRIARCIRLTIAMERKLTAERIARPGPVASDGGRRERRRLGVRGKAEAIIAAEAPGEAKLLNRRVAESLDEREFEDLLNNHPVGEIALAICRELGLPCDPIFWAADLRQEFFARPTQAPGGPSGSFAPSHAAAPRASAPDRPPPNSS